MGLQSVSLCASKKDFLGALKSVLCSLVVFGYPVGVAELSPGSTLPVRNLLSTIPLGTQGIRHNGCPSRKLQHL